VKVEITIPSAHMFLGVPDAVIQELGSELPFSQAELDELSTSVIEACTNAIEHGNGLQLDIPTRVKFEFSAERFEVTIYDQGPGFDFSHKDVSKFPQDLMRERGRGLYMMSSFCDELSFSRENGSFAVKLVKIPKGDQDSSDDEE
jgi:serine/threonine-protein kinase RsbW